VYGEVLYRLLPARNERRNKQYHKEGALSNPIENTRKRRNIDMYNHSLSWPSY
jgi:hypothetical protein